MTAIHLVERKRGNRPSSIEYVTSIVNNNMSCDSVRNLNLMAICRVGIRVRPIYTSEIGNIRACWNIGESASANRQ